MPFFSVFSACSELFVTAAVIFMVVRSLKKKPFPVRLAIGTLCFEFGINMTYMTLRMMQGSPSHLDDGVMIVLAALHGSLSLVVFAALVVLVTLAILDEKRGRHYFAEHPLQTRVFLLFWFVSVGSGEAFFALRYLL